MISTGKNAKALIVASFIKPYKIFISFYCIVKGNFSNNRMLWYYVHYYILSNCTVKLITFFEGSSQKRIYSEAFIKRSDTLIYRRQKIPRHPHYDKVKNLWNLQARHHFFITLPFLQVNCILLVCFIRSLSIRGL